MSIAHAIKRFILTVFISGIISYVKDV